MDYYIDELYAGCVSELNTLHELLEQDKDELSGCAGRELLDAYRKNTDLLLQQLDGIQKDLRIIFDAGSK